MLIDKIILSNFRAYQGRQELSLSLNPEKHVTVISGQNGFGKTSLLTGLVWVLYGKLMIDVDERYRKEIQESGGYGKYSNKLMNRNALVIANESEKVLLAQIDLSESILQKRRLKENIDGLYSFSVSIKLTNIMIPHLTCNDVTIIRSYNTRSQKEDLQILIDGKENELTQTIGLEIFINDFILPKEIAKFFFFDAEKITALAEVKSLDEKLYFSKAYNEVLGIKKYTDLKTNLENLKIKISKKSASKGDLKKIDDLQHILNDKSQLLELTKEEMLQKEEEWTVKKTDLAEIQERLVRLGSAMTNREILEFRKLKSELAESIAKNKNRFNELLELAPFAMVASKMEKVHQQLQLEQRNQHTDLINNLLSDKKRLLIGALSELKYINRDEVKQVVDEILSPEEAESANLLLSFNADQYKQFSAVHNNLKEAYARSLRALIADGKKYTSTYNITQKKLKDADLKAGDPIIGKLKTRQEELHSAVELLWEKIIELKIDTGILEKDISTVRKQLSEHTKHIKIEQHDQVKAQTSERLIKQLSDFILQLKLKKKASLEKNIKKELNLLMHKSNFVDMVEVRIDGDLIDIELYDRIGNIINKDGLSKGEQQLYATALLKALVTESNINFPVFIDSPLQKLDKRHASNILRHFYPNVSSQVVLFPLLAKELSEEEYEILLPKVGKSYLIRQDEQQSSTFSDLYPNDLFSQFNSTQAAYVQ